MPPKHKNLGFISIKKSGVFNQFFSEVKELKNNLFFIDVTQVSSKCILKHTPIDNKYLISEFIISDEHD